MSYCSPERLELDWNTKEIVRLKKKIAALEEYLGIELYEVPQHVRYIKKEEK